MSVTLSFPAKPPTTTSRHGVWTELLYARPHGRIGTSGRRTWCSVASAANTIDQHKNMLVKYYFIMKHMYV